MSAQLPDSWRFSRYIPGDTPRLLAPSTRPLAGRVLPFLVAMACGYEFAALLSRGHIPTISALQARHRWLAVLITAALALHFLRYTEKTYGAA